MALMYRLSSRCVRLSLLVSDGEDAYAVAVMSAAYPDCVDVGAVLVDDNDDEEPTQSLIQYSHWDDVRPGYKSRGIEQQCRSSVTTEQLRSGAFHPTAANLATPDEAADLESTHDFL